MIFTGSSLYKKLTFTSIITKIGLIFRVHWYSSNTPLSIQIIQNICYLECISIFINIVFVYE